MAKTGEEAEGDRIDAYVEDDRDGRSGRLRRERRGDGGGENDGHPARDEIGRERRQPIVFALRPAILDGNIPPFDKAGLAQASTEGRAGPPGGRAKIPDHRQLGLLRARAKRPTGSRASD